MLTCLDKRGAAWALVLAVFTPWLAVHAANVGQARVWADATHTRVVLEASGPLEYHIKQVGGQLLVDLGDSRLTSGFDEPPAQGLYHGMVSHQRDGRLELEARIDPDSSMKSFVLKPSTGRNYRLVIDLYPGERSLATTSASARGGADPVPSRPVAAPPSAVPPPAAADLPVVHPASSRMVASRQAAELLRGQRKVVIAVDAGHGGKDPGAHGSNGTQEKNITLAVARKLAAEINRQPGMKAVLTRDSDEFVPLKRRYQIARNNSADLFVSIHADSFSSSDARGSSVWVLSPRGKTNTAARWLADGQNRADLIGGVTLDDKDDGLAKVLLDLQQGYAMQASDAVAGNVLKALRALGPTHRSYVERANFVVLRSPDVPSILVETAFISNPTEERRLRDPAHQRMLATAVMTGVKDYFESTPPPGTWFAAQAGDRHPVLAKTRAKAPRTILARADADSDHGASGEVHKVSRGESLGSIARRYGISVGVLKDANDMRDDTVRAGAVLTIPTT